VIADENKNPATTSADVFVKPLKEKFLQMCAIPQHAFLNKFFSTIGPSANNSE